jgi:Peptidase family M23
MLLVLALLLLAPAAEGGEGGRWRWPVHGPVVEHFRLGDDPFAPGQHRGIDIAAPAGTPVRAACGGWVAFAGAVGTAGRTVSVRCGPLTATYLHLSSIAVRRRARVGAGERIGTVGTTGRPSRGGAHLHLGARRTGRRWAYVDPLSLLPRPGRLPPGPAPLPRRVPRPAAPPPPRTHPLPASPPPLPVAVWLGAGLLALGAPGVAVRRARRRRRRGPARATRRRWLALPR